MGAVRVQLVGALAVMRDGSGAEASVGSRKARLLLALLAAHRGAHVPLGQIVDALWCEQPPQRPHRAVATLVSRLRAELGRTVVVGGPAGYRLGGAPAVSVDLDEGGRLVEHGRARLAQGSAALAVAAARTACGLLDVGPVLADIPEFEWVRALRSEQAALLRSARQLRVEAALLTGEITEAVTVAEAAAGADSLDETAHRLLMRAHQAAGEPARH